MDFSVLEEYSLPQLKELGSRLDLPPKRSRNDMIDTIVEALTEYEKYKQKKLDKYTRVQKLGEGGEGVTYLVTDRNGSEYAMKTFRKQKSSKNLLREAELCRMASHEGVAPQVYNTDTVSKYIVMETMDHHLYDVAEAKGKVLNEKQQRQVINLFKGLDKALVFHGDSNIMNYMYKGRKLYIIDFGMAREINSGLVRKLGTSTPNIDIMTAGFILKLKELGFGPESYSYMLKYLPEEQRTRFGL